MKLTSSRTAISVAAVLALGIVASACGGDDDDSSTSTPAASQAPATEAPAATPAATQAPAATDAPAASEAPEEEGSGETVTVAETDLGTILVDEDGHTLYMFMPDKQGPSTCTDQCAGAWPAVAGPAAAGDGVDASLLGTATRPDDSTEQATYNGWPLYYFAQDAAPGDINGQGVNDVWWVVDPTGAAVGATSGFVNTTEDDGY